MHVPKQYSNMDTAQAFRAFVPHTAYTVSW